MGPRDIRRRLDQRPVLVVPASAAAESPITYIVVVQPYDGNVLNASSPTVTGIKLKSGEAKPAAWIYAPVLAVATSTIASGSVTALNFSLRGRAYPSAPAVTIAPPLSGTQATATVTLGDYYRVLAVKITDCGTGYWNGATVAFSAPTSGTTATGTVVTRLGKIVGVNIVNPGSGYTANPTVTFTAVSGGSDATGEAICDKGVIASYTITDAGSGYTTAPAVSFAVPSTLEPDPDDGYEDGIGWGVVLNAYPGITSPAVGDRVLLVNDDRATIGFPLVVAGVDGLFTIQGSDPVRCIVQTYLRLTDMDSDADGILPAWVPSGGGQ
jgi:hypothetical protein